MERILFGTGFECSMPMVGNHIRRDILEETGHYLNWQREFELCKGLDVRYVRYGVPYYQMHTGPDKYDWSITDRILPDMRHMGLVPILDICHYGIPEWLGDFQNTDWPKHFAAFAQEFASRYDWIQYYTPINEMFVLAKFNGRDGLWNEKLKDDKALAKGMLNIIKACQLAMKAILKANPDAVFIPCEAAEIFHEQWPSTHERVELENHLIDTTYDLLFGHELHQDAYAFLEENASLTRSRLATYLRHGKELKPHCLMGLNYFAPSERVLLPDGNTEVSPAAVGWNSLARRFYERHRMPFLLSETNNLGSEADVGPEWLWKMWHQIESLRSEGLPAIGLIWYSLLDQYDWDSLLQKVNHSNIPVGLYKMDYRPNPVEAEFRKLLHRYGELPALPEEVQKNRPVYNNWPALVKGT